MSRDAFLGGFFLRKLLFESGGVSGLAIGDFAFFRLESLKAGKGFLAGGVESGEFVGAAGGEVLRLLDHGFGFAAESFEFRVEPKEFGFGGGAAFGFGGFAGAEVGDGFCGSLGFLLGLEGGEALGFFFGGAALLNVEVSL